MLNLNEVISGTKIAALDLDNGSTTTFSFLPGHTQVNFPTYADQKLQNLNFFNKIGNAVKGEANKVGNAIKGEVKKDAPKVKAGYKKAQPYLKTAGKVAIAAGQACLAVECETYLLAAALQNLDTTIGSTTLRAGAKVYVPGATKDQQNQVYQSFAGGDSKAGADGSMDIRDAGDGMFAATQGMWNNNIGQQDNVKRIILLV